MNKAFSKEEYDRVWEDKWDDMKIYGPFARHLRRIVFRIIEKLDFSNVLDIGCGQGSFLLDLHNKYPRVRIHGTEYSQKAVQIVRNRIPDGFFEQLDLSKAAIHGKYDLVIAMEILEHIIDDVSAISNLSAMTRHYLLVSTPQGRMRKIEKQFGHVRNYTRSELVHKLTYAGFNTIKVIEWGFPFYSPIYRDLINLVNGAGTTGKYGIFQKMTARLVYFIFLFNSWNKGDELVILAEKVKYSV